MRKLLLAILVLSMKLSLYAQGWVVDEVSKDNSGGIFSGILGVLLFLGLIWLLSTLFGGKKKESSNSSTNDEYYHTDGFFNSQDDDELDIHNIEDVDFGAHVAISTSEEKKNTDANAITEQFERCLSDNAFNEKCIEIYGDYAEVTYGIIIIKEDGEYRQISSSDNRYEILSTFISQCHKERYNSIDRVGNSEQLKMYIDLEKGMLFPCARPMDSHGKLEKEFYGERIAMMMAYYDKAMGCYPLYTSNSISLRDYCLSLGWDLAIYIHRYIKQPMDWRDYHDLKDMTLRKMTKEEYLSYRSKADKISTRSDGVYDGWGNRIGSDFEEAKEELDRREVFPMAQAIKEVKELKWEL